MRKSFITKTAGMLSLMLIVAVMVPVLAFAAAYFGNVSDSNGTVTGEVYFDGDMGTSVNLDVLDSTGTAVGVVEATYNASKSGDGYYYYDFSLDYSDSTVSGSVYKDIQFQYGTTVSEMVYDRSQASSTPSYPIIIDPIVNGTTITANANGEVTASALADAFANGDDVTVIISGEFALLPAEALAEAKANGGNSITVKTDDSSYTLPLSVFDFDALVDEAGVALSDLDIKVTIAKVTDEAALTAIDAAVAAEGGERIAEPVDFKVEAVGGEDPVVVDFGSTYVARTLSVEQSVDSDHTTGVLYNADTQEITFVPSTFENVDGSTVATLLRNSNSIYTVVTLDKSFTDIPSTHFAKEDISVLANKLIVYGVTNTEFDPNREITRAEFAALVVRSLALEKDSTTSTFSDVNSTAWYAADVSAAVDAGIIYGYPDGTFRPNNTISREELASMVVRAMAFSGESVELTAAEQDQILASFSDAQALTWSKEELAVAVQEGIVYGMTSTLIEPDGSSTRAQAAAMLKRFLGNVGFID